MLKFLPLFGLFFLTHFCAKAQDLASYSSASMYTYYYKPDAKAIQREIEKSHRRENYSPDISLFLKDKALAVDSVLTGENDPELPAGTYAKVYLTGADVKVELLTLAPFRLFRQECREDKLELIAFDTLNKPLSALKIKHAGRSVPYRKKHKCYRRDEILIWGLRQHEILTVEYQDEVYLFTTEGVSRFQQARSEIKLRHNLYEIKYKYERIFYDGNLPLSLLWLKSKFDDYWTEDYAEVKAWKLDQKHRFHFFHNQPKYRMGDTVRFRLQVFEHKKMKPSKIVKKLALEINYRNTKGKAEWKEIKSFKVLPDGALVGEFLLHDTLDIAGFLELEVVYKAGYMTSFDLKVEDYELINQNVEISLEKEEHSFLDTQRVNILVEDIQGEMLPNTTVSLQIERQHVGVLHCKKCEVPKVLWETEIQLASTDSVVSIPIDIFPKADDLSYVLNYKVKSPSFPLVEETTNFVSVLDREELVTNPAELSVKDSSGFFVSYTGEDSVEVVAWGKNSVLWTKKHSPGQEIKLSGLEFSLQLYAKNGLFHAYEIPNEVVRGSIHRTGNKVFFELENPNQVPLHYQLGKGRRTIKRGVSTSKNITFSVRRKKKNYFLYAKYLWKEKTAHLFKEKLYDKHGLYIKSSLKDNYAPGDTAHIELTVLNHKKRPAKNARVVAQSHNQLFEESGNVPNLQHISSGKRSNYKYYVQNRNSYYSVEKSIQAQEITLSKKLPWAAQKKYFYLQDDPVRNLFYGAGVGVEFFDWGHEDYAGLAVVSKDNRSWGYIETPFIYYLNDLPYGNIKTKLVAAKPGKYKLSCRFDDFLFDYDSVELEAGKLLVLAFDKENSQSFLQQKSDTLQKSELKKLTSSWVLLENRSEYKKFQINFGGFSYPHAQVKSYYSLSKPDSTKKTYRSLSLGFRLKDSLEFNYTPVRHTHTQYKTLRNKDFEVNYRMPENILISSYGHYYSGLQDFYQELSHLLARSGVERFHHSDSTLSITNETFKKTPLAKKIKHFTEGTTYFTGSYSPELANLELELPFQLKYGDFLLLETKYSDTLMFSLKNILKTSVSNHRSWVRVYGIPSGKYKASIINLKSEEVAFLDTLELKKKHLHRITCDSLHWKSIPSGISIERDTAALGGVEEETTPEPGTSFTKPERLIWGKVIGEDGTGIPFVSVVIAGTQKGTQTDIEGFFKLKGPFPSKVIFSAVGFTRTEMYVKRGGVSVMLQEETTVTHAVVITGYATKIKKEFTGSSSYVDAEAIEDLPMLSVDQALQGQAAGVQVYSASGKPGEKLSIRVRGSASISPEEGFLYVVDGVITPAAEVDILKEQLRTIEVLKGEKAIAIYGTRGANGVVIMTTTKYAPPSKFSGVAKLPPTPDEKIRVRKDFRDYAFWAPNLKTDKHGKATFKAVLPDGITRWDAHFSAISGKRNGQASTHFDTKLPVSVSLKMPRFLLPGDTAYCFGVNKNFTKHKLSIQNKLEKVAPGSLLFQRSDSLLDYSIDTLKVIAENEDSLQLRYTLRSSAGFNDAEEHKIPVYKLGIYIDSGATHFCKGDTALYFKGQKGTLRVEASNIDIVLRALRKVQFYEHDCNEQLSSKLIAYFKQKEIYSALGKDFKESDDVKKQLKKVLENQGEAGGWSWFGKNEKWPPSVFVSLQVHKMLKLALLHEQLDSAEYTASAEKLNAYLYEEMPAAPYNLRMKILEQLVGEAEKDSLKKEMKFIAVHAKNFSLSEKIRFTYLKHLLGEKVETQWLLRQADTTLKGGVYWGNPNHRWYFSSTDVETTLLAYKLLKATGASEAELQRIELYFLNKRQGTYWRNTYETIAICEILLDHWKEYGKSIEEKLEFFVTENGETRKRTAPFSLELNGKDVQLEQKGAGYSYISHSVETYIGNPEKRTSRAFAITSAFEGFSPQDTLKTGTNVDLKVSVHAKKEAEYVMLKVPIPAGLSFSEKPEANYWRNEAMRTYTRSHAYIFFQHLPKGQHTLSFKLAVRYGGVYTLNPAQIELMYFPAEYANETMKKVKVW